MLHTSPMGYPDAKRAQFLAIPKLELDIIAVLAAVGDVMDCGDLTDLVAAARIRRGDHRRRVDAASLEVMLDRWQREDYVRSVEQLPAGFLCSDDVAHWALDEAAKNGALQGIVEMLRATLPAQDRYLRREPSRLYRDARLLLYLGDPTGALELVFRAREGRQRYIDPRASFAVLFGTEAPTEALALLPPLLAEYYALDVLAMVLERLAPIAASVWGHCLAVAESSEDVRERALLVALLKGDRTACRQMSVGRAPTTMAVGATLQALLSGDLLVARKHAVEALQASQGPKRTRKPKVRGPLEPYFALLLLTSPRPSERTLAQAMLAIRRRRSDMTKEACEILAEFGAFLENPSDLRDLRDGEWYFSSDPEDWSRNLFLGLYGGYTGQGRQIAETFRWETHLGRRHLAEAGYGWLAQQLDGMLPLLDGREPPQGTLGALYYARSAWEHALEALAAVSSTGQQASGTSELETVVERVLWQVTLNAPYDPPPENLDDSAYEAWLADYRRSQQEYPHGIHIEPKLQRRRPAGWTRGSVVTLARLKAASAEGVLPEEDIRVCAYIAEAPSPSRQLAMDQRVGLALLHHPNVVWRDTGSRAQVMPVEPTLVVTEGPDALRLSMRPDCFAGQESVGYQRDGDRLMVYSLQPLHHQVSRILADGIRFPLEGRARLQEALGELSNLMPVHSEVAVRGGKATQVTANSRPVVLLRRAPRGLLVQTRVFPLGLQGPSFTTGAGPVSVVGRVAGEALSTERDLDKEIALAAGLRERCMHLPEGVGAEVLLADVISCYELLSELSRLGDEVVVTWPEGQPLSVVAERDVRDLRLQLGKAGDWLTARGSLEVDEHTTLALAPLLERIREGHGRFVELGDGRLLALSENLRRRVESLGAGAKKKGKGLTIPAMALFTLADWVNEEKSADGVLTIDSAVKEQLEHLKQAQTLDPELPQTIRATLRDYQRDGFVWLCRLAHWGGGACLADDMGLGKTLQVLALLLHRAESGPALVVAPTSVCGGWIEQSTRFCPTLRPLRYGEEDRSETLAALGDHDVLITSYGLLTQDIDALAKVPFQTVVLDESQAIKNPATQRAKAARRLEAPCRVVTTGTPVENHLGEIWSQMHFLNPGLLGSGRQFELRFGRPIQRDGDQEARARLKQLLGPFILRRTKAQVLEELPPKTEVVLRVTPSAEQRAIYETVRQRALSSIGKDQPVAKHRMRLLGELMRLRRAACHPRLVAPDSGLDSAKLTTLFELHDELRDEGHRALVFSQFVDHLSLVREGLDARNTHYQYLDGKTPTKKREQAVADFQRGEGELFLISLRAGGFGLNLTAADYVIHLDPWWNPAVEDQASDRAHRIGQHRPVTIYKLVSEGTIEERILELHGHKRELAEELLAGTERSTSLSVDELRELLQTA